MNSADLVNTLLERCRSHPEKEFFFFEEKSYTGTWLTEHISRYGSHLQELGVAEGDRVVIAVGNGPAFFRTFYGVMYAGAIAVPVFPGSGPSRLKWLAAHCGANWMILDRDASDVYRQLREEGIEVLSADFPDRVHEVMSPRVSEVALLQYTSGSTGSPKGVCLSHVGLLENVSQMVDGMRITPEDVFVSWLPSYHDMGLILMTMVPFFHGCRLVLLRTRIHTGHHWLEAISRFGGTFTAAPDFAYRLCNRYIKTPEKYDLSRLRVALDAAEPVRQSTVDQFQEKFGLSSVMMPAYGLAEATVGVSCAPPGRALIADERGLVSVGHPFRDIQLKIVDEQELIQPPGTIGHIYVRTPSACMGYYGNASASKRLMSDDGYVRTGDVGYLDERGELFIAGRLKNVIISSGRTIAPQEVEECMGGFELVKSCAAVGVDRGHIEGEQVFVFVEIKRLHTMSEDEMGDLVTSMVAALYQRMGFRPGRVYLVKSGTIPRTINGKIQHSLFKQQYMDGTLKFEGRLVFPDY